MKKHPIFFNAVLIIIIAILGIVIASVSLQLFTKHGQYKTVPGVERMNYTDAINKLNKAGFKVEISSTVYRSDLKPGYVLEQTPAANTKVKPGRVVYLVVNASDPKQIELPEMKGISLRESMAILEGMGFDRSNIRVSYKMGKDKDLVIGLKVRGRAIHKGQKVSVNTPIVIEVSNGRIDSMADSLRNLEFGTFMEVNPPQMYDDGGTYYGGGGGRSSYHGGGSSSSGSSSAASTSTSTSTSSSTTEETEVVIDEDINPYATPDPAPAAAAEEE